jgi:ATP-binding cassette subfamily F protein 3
MLTFSGLSKTFAGRTLFEDATLSISHGNRVGLVGPNGAGKSTLFKIILGEESPDDGQVTLIRGTTLGFLPQESTPAADETVLEIATMHGEGDGAAEAKAKRILSGLSFRDSDFHRPAREMSGGWVMRAHLARLLVQEPDLLMLDEPTNHLDLEALIWFQSYLKSYPGAILMISHDREFLNQLTTHTVEIRHSRLFRYTGNYDSYLVQRAANEAQLVAAAANTQRKIDQLQEFVDRFGAKSSKATQAQSKLKQIERLREEMIAPPESDGPTVGFRFPQPVRSGQRVIRLEGIHHAYGENKVYEGIDFECERDQRIVLVGPNGAGKSTLLKLLAGVLEPQAGVRTLGHNVKAGYFSQYRVEMLEMRRTVLEEALETPARVTEQQVRTLLGSFLFRGDDVFKKVSVLSGGEKSRLALVKLLLDPPNLLLMDEPTTHLDMASIDALVEALKQFQGTLIFISHDVYFIRALAGHVVHVRAGQLKTYPGGYQYYLDKTAVGERAGLTAGAPALTNGQPGAQTRAAAPEPKIDRKEQKRLEAAQRQAKSDQKKALEKRVRDLEASITRMEAREKEIVVLLERPETYEPGGAAAQLNRELADIHARLPKLHAEWEAASADQAAPQPA